MNIDNNFLNFISRQRGPLAVAATALLAIVVSICSLKFGSFIVFQNLYYFPIIISCVYYLRRGFAFSVLLAFLYFFFIIAFTRDAIILQQAVIRVLIFILIAGVITFLSLRRKQAEEVLKGSEERYRTAIENSNDGVAIMKGDFYLYVNQKFLEMFGYNHPEEIIGKPLSVSVHPDDRDRVMEINLKRQKGEDVPSKYEFKGIRKNGDINYGEVSATKTIYRGEAVSLAYLRDITERKRMEAALERVSRQNSLILQSAGEGILGVDKEGKQTFVNPAAARMLGCDVEDLIGQRSHQIWHHSKKDGTPYPQAECPIYETLKDGSIKMVVDEVFWKKDGSSFPVEYTATPIGEGEKVEGSVVIFRDVTEQKRQQEEREKLIGELKDALAKVKTLSGLIPICASCKKIRDDRGYWNQIESYIHEHSDADFSHGMCPECMKKANKELDDYLEAKEKARKDKG